MFLFPSLFHSCPVEFSYQLFGVRFIIHTSQEGLKLFQAGQDKMRTMEVAELPNDRDCLTSPK